MYGKVDKIRAFLENELGSYTCNELGSLSCHGFMFLFYFIYTKKKTSVSRVAKKD